MTYYLLQSAAMLIVAYFVGCLFGCVMKSLFVTAPAEALAGGQSDFVPAPAPVRTPAPAAPAPAPMTARTATPAAPAPAPAAAPAPAPAAAKPQAPARPMTPPPGSGVSAEVTAAAAAAAAATLATATLVRAPASPVAPAAPRVPAAPAAPVTAGPVLVPGDDLKRIKGIGPEIERKLSAVGIRRYSEIASWSAADVARITKEIGQEGRIQHENWIEQAQILARGGETAFSRRVDRREVNTGMVDTWTPTAPNEVARQAAAPAHSLSAPASQSGAPASRPAVPPVPPAIAPASVAAAPAAPASSAASGSAAVAAAAAVAASTLARPVAPPTAPPGPPPASPVVAAAKPAAPPVPPAPAAVPPAAPVAPASQPISLRPAPGAGNQRRFVRLAAPEGKPDDLSLISGVGDKIAADLNRYGIYHYWQLSAMGPDDIDYMESRLGHKGRMRREEWPEQARELMAGKPPRARIDRERAHVGDVAAAPAGTTQTTTPAPARTHVHTPPQSGVPAAPAASAVSADMTPTSVGAVQGAVHHGTMHHHTHPAAPADTAGTAGDAPVTHSHGTVRHHVSGATLTASAAAAAAAVTASAGQGSAAPAAPIAAAPAAPAPAAAPVAVAPPAPPLAAPVRQAPVVPPAPPAAAPPPAAPAVPVSAPAAPAAAADASGSTWTPRSRPGNPAARTRDDLKRIKGVGVVIEKKLEAMGITSYGQIAAWKTADIEKVSNALDFKGRIERENWVEQARILDGGGQTDFSRRMDRGDMPGGGQA